MTTIRSTTPISTIHRRRPPIAMRNPFSTSMVRPGALTYRFPDGVSAAGLVRTLARHGWWGEIVGPHGSGKSTLLCQLSRHVRESGRAVEHVTLHRGQRRLPFNRGQMSCWNEKTQVIVDGYEQLWLPARLRLHSQCRRRSAGLLVATHRSAGLPALWTTRVTPAVASRLVRGLDAASLIRRSDVDAALRRHNGNLREVFFELYDLYERRSRCRASRPSVGRAGERADAPIL